MEKIWYRDLGNFMRGNRVSHFIPLGSMTLVEQLNAILRFALYFSVVIFTVRRDLRLFYFPIGTAGVTYIIMLVHEKKQLERREMFKRFGIREEGTCTLPTDNNPFMNVLMNEYAENPRRKPACEYDGTVKKDMKKRFNRNLYRSVGDIFQKGASDRQYYTTPSTTIPNDQETFASWLYGRGATCKEGNGDACYRQVPRHVNI